MNLEGISLYALTEYLNREILGSRIYKITMPTPLSLLLSLKRERDTVTLLIDVNGSAPALWLADVLPGNPAEPPSFCMLLRKHLEEGRITRISQWGMDRVIELEISLLGRGSQIITKQLIVELTGKNANLIFSENGRIVDCLKHIPAALNSVRAMQPGAEYKPPPVQQGLPILFSPPEEIVAALPDEVVPELWKVLSAHTTGIGKTTAQQLLTAADIPLKATYLLPADRSRLIDALVCLQQAVTGKSTENPCFTALISPTNRCQTIFPFNAPYLPEGFRAERFSSINDALCYAAHLSPLQPPERELLTRSVAAELRRLKKKHAILENDLIQARAADQLRMTADSLMAALYTFKKGDTVCRIPSLYDESLLEVPLSPLLSPSENAQAYYKKYNKQKRAQEEVAHQLRETEELTDWLETVEESLVLSTTRQETEEIKEELEKAGILPAPRKKRAASVRSKPLEIHFSSSTVIYIGKNNRQNDELTFKIGSGNDLWLHTQKIPGSHVLLRTSLPEAETEAVTAAAQLAAWFSKARGSSQIPVDCVPRRYVKKPSGARPGFVIFTNQKTLYVTPDPEEIRQLLEKQKK